MYDIHFKFEQKGLDPITIKNMEGDQSILEIALDNGIEIHHNCGMVAACSTCHIYIEQGDDLLPEISDKEEDFIDRARNPRINSRLGCQCILEKSSTGSLQVLVPDQSTIHGD